jgi:hypothetical protein
MKYRSIIIALGFAIMILSIPGIPRFWNDVLTALVGMAVVGVAYLAGMGPRPTV